LDHPFDPVKSLIERHRPAELDTNNAVAGLCRDAGGVLEDAWSESIAAGIERNC
jgi:hypothetical protein